MIKQITFLISGLTLLFTQVNGQTFKQQFSDLVSKGDTLGEQKLLEKWEKTDKDDPELFVAYFNYYVINSKKQLLTLGQNPEDKEALQIMNKDTTKKELVAYMYENNYYDPDSLSKDFDWITKGIEKY